jgi:hypothetical protein
VLSGPKAPSHKRTAHFPLCYSYRLQKDTHRRGKPILYEFVNWRWRPLGISLTPLYLRPIRTGCGHSIVTLLFRLCDGLSVFQLRLVRSCAVGQYQEASAALSSQIRWAGSMVSEPGMCMNRASLPISSAYCGSATESHARELALEDALEAERSAAKSSSMLSSCVQ